MHRNEVKLLFRDKVYLRPVREHYTASVVGGDITTASAVFKVTSA